MTKNGECVFKGRCAWVKSGMYRCVSHKAHSISGGADKDCGFEPSVDVRTLSDIAADLDRMGPDGIIGQRGGKCIAREIRKAIGERKGA